MGRGNLVKFSAVPISGMNEKEEEEEEKGALVVLFLLGLGEDGMAKRGGGGKE